MKAEAAQSRKRKEQKRKDEERIRRSVATLRTKKEASFISQNKISWDDSHDLCFKMGIEKVRV